MKHNIYYSIIAFCLLIATLQMSSAYTWNSSMSQGLTAYYKLDENTGTNTKDELGIKNGTLTGASSWTSSGKINNSLDLTNTNDALAIKLNPNASAKTVSFWVYPDATTGWVFDAGGTAGTAGTFFGIGFSSNNWYFYGFDTADVATGVAGITGRWQHIVVTYNGSTLFFYINNSLAVQSNKVLNTGIQYNTLLGERTNYGSQQFNGKIDEVAIWNRSLSASEISDLWNSGSGATYIPTSPLSLTNISIQAKSSFNDASINTFNITGNYTGNTTTGTIDTGIISNSTNIKTFNVIAMGFTTNTSIRNASYIAYLQPLGLTLDTPIINYTLLNTGYTINITCPITDLMGYGYTTNYWIHNIQDNTWTSQTNGSYIIKNSDYGNSLEFKCEGYNSYWFGNSSLSSNTTNINKLLLFRAKDYLGNTIGTMNMIFSDLGLTYNSNPFNEYMNVFTSGENATLNVSVIDLTYYNRDLNTSVFISQDINEYNLTLQPNKLVLSFHKSGTLTNTQGEIADLDKTMKYENSSVVIIQQDLAEGYVKVVFPV